ncbi:MAG TPA: zf-HC2 domain-containing protein [Acidobacteriaceae bacterium]|nr:zf-HC2 domain-containing protein [Acidobacteriaceae bacterium]
MTDHLPVATLSAFADGELSAEQTAAARQHVDDCHSCAAHLIDTWLLRTSIGKSAHRYALPAETEQRLRSAIAQERISFTAPQTVSSRNWMGISGWIAAAAMLAVLLTWSLIQLRGHRAGNSEYAALAAEASDLHIAALASGAPPEVLSSDRHTVKPWFQGKLPFSFNLPDSLPADTRLEGANVAYLDGRPAAQLLFSIGRHRASVFVAQRRDASRPQTITATHAGFRVVALETGDLELLAVSDAEPNRVLALQTALRDAQVSR